MWQRWQSHRSIRHSQQTHTACKLHGFVFYETGFTADESFTLQEWLFAPVTLTFTRWYTNLTLITWRYIECENMNFLRQGFRKLLSDRQTDTTAIILYHAASRVVAKATKRCQHWVTVALRYGFYSRHPQRASCSTKSWRSVKTDSFRYDFQVLRRH